MRTPRREHFEALLSLVGLDDLTLDDCVRSVRYAGDRGVWPLGLAGRSESCVTRTLSRDASRSVRRSREVLDAPSSFGFTFVGLCDLSELHPEKSADLGFMLMRRYWGQGLAQEAVTAVLAFAQQLGLASGHARGALV